MVHLISKLDGDRRAIGTFACLYGWAVDPSPKSPDNIKTLDMAKGTRSGAFYRSISYKAANVGNRVVA